MRSTVTAARVLRVVCGLLLLGSGACADQALIQVELVPLGDDPFEHVVTLRLSATGPDMETLTAEGPRSKGELRLPPVPYGSERVITVDGIDADGAVVSTGSSPPFDVTNTGPDLVRISFSRCQTVAFRDQDEDGYGDPNAVKQACTGVVGFVGNSEDCDDSDWDAFPGQTDFFDRPTRGGTGYDFNCDGIEEPEVTNVEQCAWDPTSKCTGEGWDGAIPECGQSATYSTCVKKALDCVPEDPQDRTQACR